MTFTWPWMLLMLLGLPLWLLLDIRAQRQRQQRLAQLGTMGWLRDSRGRTPGWQRHLVVALFMVGLGLLSIALARPQMPLSLPRMEGTVILAFDVSASMAATDLEPTRMEAAKAAALAFIQQQPRTVRIGVVAFSEGGLIVQPPTYDQVDLLDAINRLVPQGGTSLGEGMIASLDTILTADRPPIPADDDAVAEAASAPIPTPLPSGSFDDAAIILITDGENLAEPDPIEIAERAVDYGVQIHTVGLGTPAGTTIEVDGFMIATRLNEALLQAIAGITNGTYYNATASDDLTPIYDDLARQLTMRPEKIEVTGLFAGIGLVWLLMSGLFSLFWFGRLP